MFRLRASTLPRLSHSTPHHLQGLALPGCQSVSASSRRSTTGLMASRAATSSAEVLGPCTGTGPGTVTAADGARFAGKRVSRVSFLRVTTRTDGLTGGRGDRTGLAACVLPRGATAGGFTAGAGGLTATTVVFAAGAGGLTATAGDLAAGAGGLTATAGDLAAGAGGLTATAGGFAAGAGGLTATAGDLAAGAGGLTATAGDLAAGAGGLTATAGDLAAGAGGLTATAGDLAAGAGGLTATAGGFAAGAGGLGATTAGLAAGLGTGAGAGLTGALAGTPRVTVAPASAAGLTPHSTRPAPSGTVEGSCNTARLSSSSCCSCTPKREASPSGWSPATAVYL
jgi:hypothetical protein